MVDTQEQAQAQTHEQRAEELVERLVEATVGTLEMFSVHIGWRLNLYSILAESGPLTYVELAERSGIDDRYAQEWLEQQAVAGFVDADDPASPADTRRFRLPEGFDAVLVDPTSPVHLTPFAGMVVGIAGALPEVIDAYRTGAGVPYPRYGKDFRDGQGALNRPAFANEMLSWIDALPSGADPRMRTGARVADLGCGQGWSTLALADALPGTEILGIDSDEASVLDAKAVADAAGFAELVEFRVLDASDLAATGMYDLVCIFEALHDMARPVEVLASTRAALSESGAVLVMDERVADTFTAPGDQVERMMYGWSVAHCLPASRVESPSAALGTALRASTVSELGRAAGFGSVETLPIENDFFRFYLLTG